MDARTHFLQLARYNVWATRRLLDAVANVSEADYRKDVGLFFKSIHGTLNHLLVGEHMLWYPRFARGVSPKVELNAEVEPERDRLGQALKGGAANWLPLIEGWPAERFDGALNYTNMRGQVMSLLSRHDCGETVGTETLELLKDWLTHHILKVDKTYVAHFRAHGLG